MRNNVLLVSLLSLLGLIGLAWLSTITTETTYFATILPAQLLISIGMGFIFMSTTNLALVGVASDDAGVASAVVNTVQQVGGSIGTALLNTIAASALASYLLTHGHSSLALASGAVHSYVVAFWVSAGILIASAVVCGLVLPSGTLTHGVPGTQPAVDAVPVGDPEGDNKEMRRFARVRRTIGRFSRSRSSAGEGRNPTYVSVFATISTYEAIWQREAMASLEYVS